MKETNFISSDDLEFGKEEEIAIKSYSKLKRWGGRLHNKPELNGCEFRLSRFTIGIRLPKEKQSCIPKYLIDIPIPWMKNDHCFVVMLK